MKPILMDIPDQLETERLILRCPRPGDGAAMLDAILASRAEIGAWLPWANEEQTAETTEEYVRMAMSDFVTRKALRLLMFLKDGGAFVGLSSLHSINWRLPKAELGYWLDTRYSGCGYAVEAVKRLTDFAHDTLGMVRVDIHCDSLNVKSRGVAERAGFVFEARLYHSWRGVEGELRDELIFARIWPDTRQVEPEQRHNTPNNMY